MCDAAAPRTLVSDVLDGAGVNVNMGAMLSSTVMDWTDAVVRVFGEGDGAVTAVSSLSRESSSSSSSSSSSFLLVYGSVVMQILVLVVDLGVWCSRAQHQRHPATLC
jgi:hypothetical protein